jgi:hypothetical protein
LFKEGRLKVPTLVRRWDIDAKGQNVFRINAYTRCQEPPEALYHEPCAHEQHKSQSELCYHQDALARKWPEGGMASLTRTRAFEGTGEVWVGCGDRRKKAENHSGNQRYSKREQERAAVQVNGIQADLGEARYADSRERTSVRRIDRSQKPHATERHRDAEESACDRE